MSMTAEDLLGSNGFEFVFLPSTALGWGDAVLLNLTKLPAHYYRKAGTLHISRHAAPECICDSSLELYKQIPNAILFYYPDSDHGSFNQYPEMFVTQATGFLNYFE